MAEVSRRELMQMAATLAAGSSMPPGALAAPETSLPGKDAPAPAVTHALARWVVGTSIDGVPAGVRREATRTLLNYMAVAVGGSHHETVEIAVSALSPFSGPPQATLLGRTERFDVMNAAFVNGV